MSIERAIETELTGALKSDGTRLAERSSINLAWFKAATPQISECQFGTARDLDSNVKSPIGFEELRAIDLESNLVNRKSGLYKGNIDASLPSPDNDLPFQLSALPAPVKRTIAGARLLSNERIQGMKQFAPQQQKLSFSGKIPCAVRLKIITPVSASARRELSGNVANISAALTDGATPFPDEEP